MSRSRALGRCLFENIIRSNMDKPGVDKPEPLHDPPSCIKCGEGMCFSCTEIEKPGFVHHVYECKKCRSTQSFVTAR